ncbi:hypothetical protein EZJ43_13350 [Pedobacter changchengzhani]|uniref:Uncharacterized protein n=1 Tax=Pedobacter changchengzhani TaxID=2529274 RepID=A0A4R5MJ58_9SPHI|nr:hypothetical protein [Pedobacter changchengzhani]TDG35601.1 hypothetical protein EZJ43_13350 [Pedobacter changchengzhani]
MRRNLLIFFGLVFIGTLVLLFKWSGYEFPNENKHPEIPFFPKTTNGSTLINKRVDSMYIRAYQILKKSDLILVNYAKDSLENNSSELAVVTKSFSPVFYLHAKQALNYSFDEKRNLLCVVESSTDTTLAVVVFNITKRKREIVKNLTIATYQELFNSLAVVKHFSPHRDFTQGIFFTDTNGQIYFAKSELANAISKVVKMEEADNFNFTISITYAGDATIHTKNIKVFDNTVVSNHFKRLLAYGTPSSPGGDGNPPNFPEDKGWFDKWRYYFFKIRLKNKEAEFKTNLYNNSGTYFDELSEPKTDQDTLLYYSENRFYQFYAK